MIIHKQISSKGVVFVEKTKMKAKSLRAAAWNALKGHYGVALLAALIAGIFGVTSIGIGSTSAGTKNVTEPTNVSAITANLPAWIPLLIIGMVISIFIISLVMTVLSASVGLGYSMFNIKLINGENPDAGVCFSRMKHIWKAFGLNFVMGLKVFLWSLLLVFPGIIAFYRYSMAKYIMAENPDISISEAIDRSKQMMKGEKWNLFCVHISFIWWALLAAIIPVIGAFLLTPYTEAAEAAFYLNRTDRLNG